jgi:hypothetical protein
MGDGDLDRSQELRAVAEVRHRGAGWVLMIYEVIIGIVLVHVMDIGWLSYYSCCVTGGISLSSAVEACLLINSEMI